MSLIANAVEASGVPTLVIGTVRDLMELSPAPRAVFVDYPVGRTFGPPNQPARHREVLRSALELLPSFVRYGQILDLPLTWNGPDRAWETVVRNEIAPGR